jgi:hypothetical protein
MTRQQRESIVDEAVALLVKHYGVDEVRAALARADNGEHGTGDRPHRGSSTKRSSPPGASISGRLADLRKTDEKRHSLLAAFYAQLKGRSVLPESQDIRQFAQVIGLKQIDGKSRRDMIPKLMQFLFEQPLARLQINVERAADISEAQRKKGFSVITDNLLGAVPQAGTGAVAR